MRMRHTPRAKIMFSTTTMSFDLLQMLTFGSLVSYGAPERPLISSFCEESELRFDSFESRNAQNQKSPTLLMSFDIPEMLDFGNFRSAGFKRRP